MDSRSAATWDRADLVRRLARALAAAGRAVERLAAAGHGDALDHAGEARPHGVVSDTALLLLAASEVEGEPEISAEADRIARRLIGQARSAHVRMRICFEPALALDHASAHACLARMGHSDAGFDALLRAVARSQAFAAREHRPHRALEQLWVAELCGLGPPGGSPGVHALAEMSVLGRPLDLVGAGREDLRAWTQALMYLKTPRLSPRRLPRPRVELLREAEVALARCLDEEDYGLAAGLLLAWPLTGGHWSAGAAFAFRTLAVVEDEVGILPSPATRPEHLDRFDGRQRADCLLAGAWHTTLAMGLLCAACLAPGRGPPAHVAGRARDPGPPDALAAQLAADGGTRHWSLAYAGLPRTARPALAGFLHEIALRRAIAARDLAAIHAQVAAAGEAGHADGPQWRQVAELLERIAALSDQCGGQAEARPLLARRRGLTSV